MLPRRFQTQATAPNPCHDAGTTNTETWGLALMGWRSTGTMAPHCGARVSCKAECDCTRAEPLWVRCTFSPTCGISSHPHTQGDIELINTIGNMRRRASRPRVGRKAIVIARCQSKGCCSITTANRNAHIGGFLAGLLHEGAPLIRGGIVLWLRWQATVRIRHQAWRGGMQSVSVRCAT